METSAELALLKAELFAQGILLNAMLEVGQNNAELERWLKLHAESYIGRLLGSQSSDTHIALLEMALGRWIERVEKANELRSGGGSKGVT